MVCLLGVVDVSSLLQPLAARIYSTNRLFWDSNAKTFRAARLGLSLM
jgi:hypothetical protein